MSRTEHLVYLDLYCGEKRAERLTLKDGDDFKAEVLCDDYRIEVVGFNTIKANSDSERYKGSELDRDAYEGFRLPECPACGQTHAPPYVDSLCIECEKTFDIAEIEVTWNDC